LKNVGPIRHNEPPHANSPDVASGTGAACASMSTTTTTTTTRDRGDHYGPMEWAQLQKVKYIALSASLPSGLNKTRNVWQS